MKQRAFFIALILVIGCVFSGTASATSQASFLHVPNVAAGDVDANERVDALDALYVLRASVGINTYNTYAAWLGDTTGDGIIGPADALEILQVAVGKRKSFSVDRSVCLYHSSSYTTGWEDGLAEPEGISDMYLCFSQEQWDHSLQQLFTDPTAAGIQEARSWFEAEIIPSGIGFDANAACVGYVVHTGPFETYVFTGNDYVVTDQGSKKLILRAEHRFFQEQDDFLQDLAKPTTELHQLTTFADYLEGLNEIQLEITEQTYVVAADDNRYVLSQADAKPRITTIIPHA